MTVKIKKSVGKPANENQRAADQAGKTEAAQAFASFEPVIEYRPVQELTRISHRRGVFLWHESKGPEVEEVSTAWVAIEVSGRAPSSAGLRRVVDR